MQTQRIRYIPFLIILGVDNDCLAIETRIWHDMCAEPGGTSRALQFSATFDC